MTPAAVLLVFRVRVLGVVKEQIRTATKSDKLGEAGAIPVVKPQFVVRQEDEGLAIFMEFEAETAVWMVQRDRPANRPVIHRPDLSCARPAAFATELNLRPQLVKRHWKERRLHLAPQVFAK
jgi:hypothetical protein